MEALLLAAAIHRVAVTDDPQQLATIAGEILAAHPGDAEAGTVARQAELKRRRIIQEG